MHYLVYFVGPFVLAVMGARLLRQRFRVAASGFVAFLLAWSVMESVVVLARLRFGVTDNSLLFATFLFLISSVCEESARFIVFRRLKSFEGNRTWRSALTYALGHHGMETMIVGVGVLLVYFGARYTIETTSNAETLKACQDVLALGAGSQLLHALERLSVGLLVHTCLSGVVMLAVARGRARWLLLAMAWHFVHNMIGQALPQLSDHWIMSKGWLTIIVIGYSYLAVRIYQALAQGSPTASAGNDGEPTARILPGREQKLHQP